LFGRGLVLTVEQAQLGVVEALLETPLPTKLLVAPSILMRWSLGSTLP
jgi:hypothetical protein